VNFGVAQANSSAVLTKESTMSTKRRLSTDEAAEYLGVSPKLLRKAVKEKKLRAYRIGERIYRFDPSDLDAFERAIGKGA
jgi:excisionase family DNA binding protein